MVVAVTGGICDGKSVVVSMFAECGAETWSADAAAKKLLERGEVLESVLSVFPECRMPDGSLDRRKLAEIVANDEVARYKLNAIMHPPIIARMRSAVAQKRAAVFVAEVPLLIECALQGDFDRVVVARAGVRRQLERLTERVCDPSLARRLLHTQLATAAKSAFADWEIRTNREKGATLAQVQRIWTLLVNAPSVESRERI